MSVTHDPLEFFEEVKEASKHKLELLQKYLKPLSYKLLYGWQRMWVVDGFAGAGLYEPDDDGVEHPGSPRIAAVWARQLELKHGEPVLRCINVEAKTAVFERLQHNLAPWKHLVEFRRGEFDEHLDAILTTIGGDPAFFFLDPFGVNGIEMELLDRILARPCQTTELLIHFSDKSFRRMAGHLNDNTQRTKVGQAVADAKVARLDAIVGSKLWQRIWLDKDRTTDERIEAIQALYCSQLKARGFKFAHSIAMRDSFGKRARYTLVFATNHPDGVDLMSDLACSYGRAQHDEHLDNGTFDLLWEQGRREDEVGSSLRDDIHRFGLAAGIASPLDIRQALVDERFAQYRKADYSKAIRMLVKEGRIARPNAAGIKEKEPLTFVRPPQQTMFG
jgi:three-Cys-motif partner protein